MKVTTRNLFISPATGRILCDPGKVLVGNAEGIAVPSTTIPTPGLPDLTHNDTWVGDENNRPIELPYISAEAFAASTFVLRTADPALPNAQALLPLGQGILKTVADGFLAIASPNTDYATVAGLDAILAQTVLARDAAAAAATAAGVSAIAAGISAGAAAASATSAQQSATDAFNYYTTILNTGLNALPNNGDVNIQGYRVKNLAQPVEDLDGVPFEFLWNLMHDELDIQFVSAP